MTDGNVAIASAHNNNNNNFSILAIITTDSLNKYRANRLLNENIITKHWQTLLLDAFNVLSRLPSGLR